jgi:hypothetical protein
MTTIKEWLDKGSALAEQNTTQKWLIADWLAAGDTAFGGPAYDHAQSLFPDLSRKYLIQLAYTARNVADTVRQYKLSFTHHELVASLEPSEQDRLLTAAVKNGWTCGELRRQIKIDRPDSCSVSLSYDLFQQLTEFSKGINVSPEALLSTALQLFFQAPPLDLQSQYELSVINRREQEEERKRKYAEQWVVEQEREKERKKIAEERAAFVQSVNTAVNQIDKKLIPEVNSLAFSDQWDRLGDMLHCGIYTIAEIQEQLDKLLALCKQPVAATNAEMEALGAEV